MNGVATWWRAKTRNEQFIIAGLGAAGVVVALWLLVLKPVFAYRAGAERSYASAVELLNEIQAGAAEAQELRKTVDQPAVRADEPFRVSAGGSARALGLSVARVQPSQNGGLTLWLEDADPKLLYRWLVRLEQDYGAPVDKITIDRNPGATTVRAIVLVQEPSA